MRVLITGAGMLGSALEAEAQARLLQVTLLTRSMCDITVAAEVESAVRQARPDLIFHTAALTRVNYCEEQPYEAQLVNATGTGHVVHAASLVHARLVYFSTDYVFPGRVAAPIFEGSPTGPLNVYGASKLAGEEYVAGYPLGHIVRTSGVFGPRPDRQERNFFRAIFEKLTTGQDPVEVVEDQFTAVSYAPHLAAMVFGLIESGLAQETHLTSAGQNSWYGWAVDLARMVGADISQIVPVPTPAGSPVRRPCYSVLGTSQPQVDRVMSQFPAANGISAYVGQLKGT